MSNLSMFCRSSLVMADRSSAIIRNWAFRSFAVCIKLMTNSLKENVLKLPGLYWAHVQVAMYSYCPTILESSLLALHENSNMQYNLAQS